MSAFLRLFSLWLLTALLMLAGCVADEPDIRTLVSVGQSVPAFEVRLSDGTVITDKSLLGAPAVIAFFNTGCPDCRHELPELQKLHEALPKLAMVCIARDESAESVSKFWSASRLSLPYSPQPDASVYRLFATGGIPRVYLLESSGKVSAEFGPDNMPDVGKLLSLIAQISNEHL